MFTVLDERLWFPDARRAPIGGDLDGLIAGDGGTGARGGNIENVTLNNAHNMIIIHNTSQSYQGTINKLTNNTIK